MALNITQGSGTPIATDIIGTPSAPSSGQHLQYIKQDLGGAGLTVPWENATAANLGAILTTKAALVQEPGCWAQGHSPAVNTQATTSKAAGGAGVRHVCRSVSIVVYGGTTAPAATIVTAVLRDGATGAGTILQTWTFSVAAAVGAQCQPINLTGLNIIGSANTAMTLETTAAPGANIGAAVNMSGTTTPAA